MHLSDVSGIQKIGFSSTQNESEKWIETQFEQSFFSFLPKKALFVEILHFYQSCRALWCCIRNPKTWISVARLASLITSPPWKTALVASMDAAQNACDNFDKKEIFRHVPPSHIKKVFFSQKARIYGAYFGLFGRKWEFALNISLSA